MTTSDFKEWLTASKWIRKVFVKTGTKPPLFTVTLRPFTSVSLETLMSSQAKGRVNSNLFNSQTNSLAWIYRQAKISSVQPQPGSIATLILSWTSLLSNSKIQIGTSSDLTTITSHFQTKISQTLSSLKTSTLATHLFPFLLLGKIS